MHEKVKAYLDEQHKHINTHELYERARMLISAGLYDTYQGPHVEELFDPIWPNKSIKQTETTQYVVERGSGNVVAVSYNLKDKEFMVLTPLEVTDEEYVQILRYHKPSSSLMNPMVLNVSAYILYVLAIGFFMASIIQPTFNWGYILGAISIIDGLILNVLAMIIKTLRA